MPVSKSVQLIVPSEEDVYTIPSLVVSILNKVKLCCNILSFAHNKTKRQITTIKEYSYFMLFRMQECTESYVIFSCNLT